jgi:hypothetical protein
MGDPLLVNDHHHPGVDRNEVLMWHRKSFSVGQLKGKGLKPIVQPLSNLIYYHAVKLLPARAHDKLPLSHQRNPSKQLI